MRREVVSSVCSLLLRSAASVEGIFLKGHPKESGTFFFASCIIYIYTSMINVTIKITMITCEYLTITGTGRFTVFGGRGRGTVVRGGGVFILKI